MYSYKGCIGYQVAKAVQITKKNVVTVKFGQYVSSKEFFILILSMRIKQQSKLNKPRRKMTVKLVMP